MSVYTHMLAYGIQKRGCQLSSSITLYHIALWHYLSQNLKLTILAKMASQNVSKTSLSQIPDVRVIGTHSHVQLFGEI